MLLLAGCSRLQCSLHQPSSWLAEGRVGPSADVATGDMAWPWLLHISTLALPEPPDVLNIGDSDVNSRSAMANQLIGR